ncbi:MAG: hypothetical protein ACM3PY_05215, partial [Omnitrophica WOR_2 bacterium]
GISVVSYANYILALNFLLILVSDLIAAVIFWRRRDEWMALFVSFVLVTNGAVFPLTAMYSSGDFPRLLLLLVNIVAYLGVVSSILLLYTFPDGKFIPSWTLGFGIAWTLLNLPAVFAPRSPWSILTWPAWIQLLLLLVASGAGVLAQVYRYWNVSSPSQRQQAKWALFGLMAAALGPFAFFLSFVILPSVSEPAIPTILYNRLGTAFFTLSIILQILNVTTFTVMALLFPLSFAIAIMRYRLWEIDILFNRALVYSVLTTLLAFVYFFSVVLLQGFFSLLTGQDQNEIVTVLSTLVIAALFVPLQRRIQTMIDQRFYRRRYNIAKTLAQFNASLRNEVDLQALTDRLLSIIDDTMQPGSVSLWLKESPVEKSILSRMPPMEGIPEKERAEQEV